ncbi:MAG: flagellar export chaperone FlgN [Myxococcota bacterium]
MSIDKGIEELREEISILDKLTHLLRESRQIRLDQIQLAKCLEDQAQLCDILTTRKERRAAVLHASGYQPQDLLVALLAVAPKTDHDSIIETFGLYVEAAEQAQTEIDMNREFFSVALAAVEDALNAAVPEGRPATYEVSSKRRSSGSVMICRQI